jgi:hypothetical protein
MRAKNVRVYDNGGETADRYTVVYMGMPEGQGSYGARGMDAHPFHPQGIGMWVSAMPGRHLGKRIRLEDLPADCQRVVHLDLADCP